MSQPTVASYFNTRKRVAVDELSAARNKVLVLEYNQDLTKSSDSDRIENAKIIFANTKNVFSKNENAATSVRPTRSTRAIKRIGAVTLDDKALISEATQPKLVKFMKMGNLSPQKKMTPTKTPPKDKNVGSPSKTFDFFAAKKSTNIERGMRTPTKQTIQPMIPSKDKANVVNNMSIDEIKAKLSRSTRIAELKTSLNKLHSGFDKLDRLEKARTSVKAPAPATAPVRNLKEFKSIELEIEVSPSKAFKSPVKRIQSTILSKHSELMSPKKEVTPKKLLFSPVKEGSSVVSPTKLPAYQRFQELAESSRPSLQMPYKYRCLSELFKCMDTVCAMFFNRNEKITFKKLKPAVQRMLRKNVYESHLAQIKALFPEAYAFTQEKTRNYGSATKQDYFQLVIVPKVEHSTKESKLDESNIIKSAQNASMNPQVMIERYQKFNKMLLDKIKDEHENFLLNLNPPMRIQREKLTRWHPEFELEKCPEIPQAEMPQPPNTEKFSSAKEILSTARNLFSCNTPMERALERLEAKKKASEGHEQGFAPLVETVKKTEGISSVLKNVPKSLLEKIRAKQAAKALDEMTRRPSQEKEAIKHARLPELARHVRNVFVTEKRGVLPLDQTLIKIENSYRGKITLKELEEHLKIIASLVPSWLSFHEVRKNMFVKVSRDTDLAKIVGVLEQKANILAK